MSEENSSSCGRGDDGNQNRFAGKGAATPTRRPFCILRTWVMLAALS